MFKIKCTALNIYQNVKIFQAWRAIELVITDQLDWLHLLPELNSLVCVRQDFLQIVCIHIIKIFNFQIKYYL